jgi:hypothetical protein
MKFPWDEIKKEETVVLVDFSLQPYEDMIKLYNATGGNLIWIDHHSTAIIAVTTLMKEHNIKDIPGLCSTSKSGCELAWDYYIKTDIIPAAVQYIGDYDTWKFKYDLLYKQYTIEKDKLINHNPDPYALKGNINAKYIYHYTTGDNLIGIINDNILIGDEGISFTTHPNLYKRGFVFWYPGKYSEGRHTKNVGIKIKFDFDAMKNSGLKFKVGSEGLGTNHGEEELRLMKYELKNPIRFIKEIIIFKEKEKNYIKVSELLDSKHIKYKIV